MLHRWPNATVCWVAVSSSLRPKGRTTNRFPPSLHHHPPHPHSARFSYQGNLKIGSIPRASSAGVILKRGSILPDPLKHGSSGPKARPIPAWANGPGTRHQERMKGWKPDPCRRRMHLVPRWVAPTGLMGFGSSHLGRRSLHSLAPGWYGPGLQPWEHALNKQRIDPISDLRGIIY